MNSGDDVLLSAIFEKLRRGMSISKEEWGLWFSFVLNSKYSISSCTPEEFAGLQAQLQQGVRKVFLGGNQ